MSLELQNFLFAQNPSRRMLMEYSSQERPEYRIQVFRNHSFELVEHTIHAYLDYAQIGVSFSYSGYDDSFSFLELDPSVDALIVWIDATRYKNTELTKFFQERFHALRAQYTKPILVIPFGTEFPPFEQTITVFSLQGVETELGTRFIDERAQTITGTKLSSKAMLAISKELGLRYLPALLKPSLKAVVVDFDNTLYHGVLGEDGVDGVELTPAHIQLQTQLKELSKQGYFLCAASKNQLEDVELLLEKRLDFPLKKEDFTKLCVSWSPKADSIAQLAKYLNIHTNSMVFIDDNIGELMAVQADHPEIHLIQAYEDAAITAETLKWYPGLLRLNTTTEDSVRKVDTIANEQRRKLQGQLSKEDYIRSLQLKLTFTHTDVEHQMRIAELSNKTNQFIFNYMRYSQDDIAIRMNSEEYEIVSISLSDRLSDSGLIGVCVGKKQNDYVELEECFISCRALGRGIDDVIVLGAVQEILKHFNIQTLKVAFQPGARNAPAERFVQEYFAQHLRAPATFSYKLPENLLQIEIKEN